MHRKLRSLPDDFGLQPTLSGSQSFAFDRFGVATSAEERYIESMQSSNVELDGDAFNLIHIAIDAYALRDVPFLTVAPLGCDI